MSFLLFVFIGMIAIKIIWFRRNRILDKMKISDTWIQSLKNASWFQNHWLGGIFLFFVNAFLFSFTAFCLYLLTYLTIPFLHLFIMLLAVVVSIFVWVIIYRAWQGSRRNRLKMGLIGSSFYALLLFFFLHRLTTLKPAFPGDDTFMAAVGLIFGIIVAAVAFITCFVLTAFSKKT